MILTKKNRIEFFTKRGWWGEDTLYSLFQDAVSSSGDQEALIDPLNRADITGDAPKRLSFNEVDKTVERYASIFFEQGLRKDDIALIQLPNVVELPIVYLALSKLGIICSPIPMQYGAYEINSIIAETKPKAFISIQTFNKSAHAEQFLSAFTNNELKFALGEIENFIDLHTHKPVSETYESQQSYAQDNPITANDIFTICWTSGTTGTPKGVPRSHNLWLPMAKAAGYVSETEEGDTLLNPFPMINMASIGGFLFNWLLCKGKLVQHHPFDLNVFLNQIVNEDVKYTIAPPAIMNMLLNNPAILDQHDLSSLRSIGCGGAPLSEWMVESFQNKYNLTVQNIFGSNEGATLLSARHEIEDPHLRAQYFPRFGVEGLDWSNPVSKLVKTKLINVETNKEINESGQPGELLISGATVFDGYWNAPEANAEVFDEEGFFRTGDLFEISPEDTDKKFYKFCGRCKDLIIRGGMNISPEELDNLLSSHPKMLEVAVTGYDDEILGEKVGVVAVVAKGVTISLDEIIDFLKDKQIAKYKMPEDLRVIDVLPKNPVGKVLRRELKDLFN
ncbi:MAG: (2,3-dihydroxybenzoyl)adenylate synthase [SAR86 cluster bacterium]|uniref:(2,3-dihydroxybenzoyl)adenylate synthase n=1 Tax=SAR86 cluster bacterium TaxID=2030880 RepID=A0A520MTH7_9GAMM|nr:MAG: (2,3-dihydroxybenzoyl)adenylate synthase [SAR86 cluster bacterium]